MNCQASNEHIIKRLAHRQDCIDSGYSVGPAWAFMFFNGYQPKSLGQMYMDEYYKA